jgi:hypothetical protein
MADKSQLRKAEQFEPPKEDDPFAELTRIMGFDPRVPVTRTKPQIAEHPAPAEEDDFTIDLEKELMGEFSDLREQEPQAEHETENAAAETVEAATPTDELNGAFEAAFEDELAVADGQAEAIEDEIEEAVAQDQPADEQSAPEAIGEAPAEDFAPTEDIENVATAGLEDELDGVAEAEQATDNLPDEAMSKAAEEAAPAAETAVSDEVVPSPWLDDELKSETDANAWESQEDRIDAEDVPVLHLGSARDFGTSDEALAEVEMDFDPKFADDLVQSVEEQAEESRSEGMDLEEELSALLGRGVASRDFREGAEQVDEPARFEEPFISDAPASASYEDEDRSEPVVRSDGSFGEDLGSGHVESANEQERDESQALEAEADWSDHGPVATYETQEPVDEADAPIDEVKSPATAYDDPLEDFLAGQDLEAENAVRAGEAEIQESVPVTTVDDGHALDEEVVRDLEEAAEDAVRERSDEGQAYAAQDDLNTAGTDQEIEEVADDPADEWPVTEEHEQAAKAETEQPQSAEEDPFAALAALVRGMPSITSSPATAPVPAASAFTPAAGTAFTTTSSQNSSWSKAPVANETPSVSTTAYQYQSNSSARGMPASVPDIETVDVPEAPVAYADDLDLPEVSLEEEKPAMPDFDDFEAELAGAFGQSMAQQPAPEPDNHATSRDHANYGQRHEESTAGTGFLAGATITRASAAGTGSSTGMAAESTDEEDRYRDFDLGDGFGGSHNLEGYGGGDRDFEYDPDHQEEIPAAYQGSSEERASNRRGLTIAAIVGGVIALGGIGAFALSFAGGDGSGTPALVRADDGPVKVRPENPGGSNVPNQDNKVFQAMKGSNDAAAPKQEKLISTGEEPVNVAERAQPRVVTPQSAAALEPAENSDNAELPGVEDEPVLADAADDPIAAEIAAAPKGEDRIEQTASADSQAENGEIIAVQPRRVRTMVVRPDGTLVPQEEPAPAAAQQQPENAGQTASLEPADPSQNLADPSAAPEATASLQPSGSEPLKAPAAGGTARESATPASQAAAPAAEPAPRQPEPTSPAQAGGTPNSGPTVPSRPADQPMNVVGEVGGEQVAAANTAAANAGAAWSVQIASQPNQAAAQSTYENLARRYGDVIGGRGVNIVKADIAGKGTYWRVRVPAGSREEAISLCENYKSAGGNCFVSR